jgi:hypothetical protein
MISPQQLGGEVPGWTLMKLLAENCEVTLMSGGPLGGVVLRVVVSTMARGRRSSRKPTSTSRPITPLVRMPVPSVQDFGISFQGQLLLDADLGTGGLHNHDP